jgi:nucleoside-diphosphate-sugar epimerase
VIIDLMCAYIVVQSINLIMYVHVSLCFDTAVGPAFRSLFVAGHDDLTNPTMLIAVTGANGTIGRRVVLLALKQGHHVRGIDSSSSSARTAFRNADDENEDRWVIAHPSYTAVTADLQDARKTQEVLAGADAIITLAGIPHPGDGLYDVHNTNVVISFNVFRAAAELGIWRIAAASSVNVIGLVFNRVRHFDYLPLDEEHPCRPDEPYGLSKQSVTLLWRLHLAAHHVPPRILEMQAAAICRRYPSMRIASLRMSWTVPERAMAQGKGDRANDLWGYTQWDAAADACLRAVGTSPAGWEAGHEAFFVVSPRTTSDESFETLHRRAYPDVRVKEPPPEEAWTGFVDCAKAERMLGWTHKD